MFLNLKWTCQLKKKIHLKASNWREDYYFFLICVQWGDYFSTMSQGLACICKAMAWLGLEITSAEPQLCVFNAVSASLKVGTFKIMVWSLISEMLWKRKTQCFLKTLIEHWGRWQWEKVEKQPLVQTKCFIFQFTLVMEHIALSFVAECYLIKRMQIGVHVAAVACT